MRISRASLLALAAVAAVACSDNRHDPENDSDVSGTTASTTVDGASAAAAAIAGSPCEESADHVVIISDFAYSPSFLNVKVGETVAWVNMEACGDMPAEELAIPLAGCDTHHEVVTFPASPGGDSIDSGDLCSPNRGVAGPPAGLPIDVDNCADEGGSNVFCHTFEHPGLQHYTCFVNPGHTLLLHGFINVSE